MKNKTRTINKTKNIRIRNKNRGTRNKIRTNRNKTRKKGIFSGGGLFTKQHSCPRNITDIKQYRYTNIPTCHDSLSNFDFDNMGPKYRIEFVDREIHCEIMKIFNQKICLTYRRHEIIEQKKTGDSHHVPDDAIEETVSRMVSESGLSDSQVQNIQSSLSESSDLPSYSSLFGKEHQSGGGIYSYLKKKTKEISHYSMVPDSNIVSKAILYAIEHTKRYLEEIDYKEVWYDRAGAGGLRFTTTPVPWVMIGNIINGYIINFFSKILRSKKYLALVGAATAVVSGGITAAAAAGTAAGIATTAVAAPAISTSATAGLSSGLISFMAESISSYIRVWKIIGPIISISVGHILKTRFKQICFIDNWWNPEVSENTTKDCTDVFNISENKLAQTFLSNITKIKNKDHKDLKEVFDKLSI